MDDFQKKSHQLSQVKNGSVMGDGGGESSDKSEVYDMDLMVERKNYNSTFQESIDNSSISKEYPSQSTHQINQIPEKNKNAHDPNATSCENRNKHSYNSSLNIDFERQGIQFPCGYSNFAAMQEMMQQYFESLYSPLIRPFTENKSSVNLTATSKNETKHWDSLSRDDKDQREEFSTEAASKEKPSVELAYNQLCESIFTSRQPLAADLLLAEKISSCPKLQVTLEDLQKESQYATSACVESTGQNLPYSSKAIDKTDKIAYQKELKAMINNPHKQHEEKTSVQEKLFLYETEVKCDENSGDKSTTFKPIQRQMHKNEPGHAFDLSAGSTEAYPAAQSSSYVRADVNNTCFSNTGNQNISLFTIAASNNVKNVFSPPSFSSFPSSENEKDKSKSNPINLSSSEQSQRTPVSAQNIAENQTTKSNTREQQQDKSNKDEITESRRNNCSQHGDLTNKLGWYNQLSDRELFVLFMLNHQHNLMSIPAAQSSAALKVDKQPNNYSTSQHPSSSWVLPSAMLMLQQQRLASRPLTPREQYLDDGSSDVSDAIPKDDMSKELEICQDQSQYSKKENSQAATSCNSEPTKRFVNKELPENLNMMQCKLEDEQVHTIQNMCNSTEGKMC